MYDCHGRLYSRFGSQSGCASVGLEVDRVRDRALVELLEVAEALRSRAQSQAVGTMMSRSIPWPRESGAWISPKNSSFELMSSR